MIIILLIFDFGVINLFIKNENSNKNEFSRKKSVSNFKIIKNYV